MSQSESQTIAEETPADDVFIPPSISRERISSGESYSHVSAVPSAVSADQGIECVLGIDEAGRGPVLGPMVYGVFYLPLTQHRTLLSETHHFDDSKALTPAVRSRLMQTLCDHQSDLYQACGWATHSISARDISSNMLRPGGAAINLNAQAMDATANLITSVLEQGVNLREIYVDTIGPPATYQAKLQRLFPAVPSITVAKKADSLYPCVSAASVCAKVTRDAALETSHALYVDGSMSAGAHWGSGYPSDARCTTWMREHMDPLFGWGAVCRYSWGTAKDMLEGGGTKGPGGTKVTWPDSQPEEASRLSHFLNGKDAGSSARPGQELANWYGTNVTEDVF